MLIAICVGSTVAWVPVGPAAAQVTAATATVFGQVLDAAGAPVGGANLVLSGPSRVSLTSDARGNFSFTNVAYGEYRLDVTTPELGRVTRDRILVASDTRVGIQFDSTSNAAGAKIIGRVSSSASARFNVSPIAITSLTTADLADQGASTWRRVLEEIPGVSISSANATYAATGSPLAPQIISIGGTLPYETATLIDGMPIVTISTGSGAGGGVNLDQYNPNAFGSFDVVRGPGAQSASIVNAIGGSINLHPTSYVSANHFEFTTSNDVYGGIVSNLTARVHAGKLSFAGSYGVNDSPGPSVNTGGYKYNQLPATVDGKALTCTANCGTTISGGIVGSSFVACCINVSDAWSQHSGSASLRYDLSPAVSAQVFYAGQTFDAPLGGGLYTVNFQPAAAYAGTYPRGISSLYSGNYALSGSNYKLSSSVLEEKIDAAIGPGRLHLAALQNRTSQYYNNSTSGAPLTLQLFGSGTVGGTPATFNGESHVVTYAPLLSNGNWYSNNRDLSAGYDVALGDRAHAGISYVRSYYNTPFDFTSLSGAGVPVTTAIWTNQPYQAASEWRLNIGGEPIARVSVDASLYVASDRYHVPDPAYATTAYADKSYAYTGPRAGVVWKPTAALAVRAAAGSGFAQPGLTSLIGSNGAPLANSAGAPTFYTQSLENVDLKPETSFGVSAGADLRIRENTVASLDVYRTNLWGQFYTVQAVTGTYLGLPLYTSQQINLGQSRYEGVLLSVRHDVQQGFNWSVSGGLTRGYLVNVPAGFYNGSTGVDTKNLSILPAINFNGATSPNVPIPYSQGYASAGYRWRDGISAFVNATYYGPNNSYFRPAFAVFNFNGEVPLGHTVSLHASVQNITGIYDGNTLIVDPSTIANLPTVAGAPVQTVYRQQYGPQAFILSLTIRN